MIAIWIFSVLLVAGMIAMNASVVGKIRMMEDKKSTLSVEEARQIMADKAKTEKKGARLTKIVISGGIVMILSALCLSVAVASFRSESWLGRTGWAVEFLVFEAATITLASSAGIWGWCKLSDAIEPVISRLVYRQFSRVVEG